MTSGALALLGCAALAAQTPQGGLPSAAPVARGIVLERDSGNAGGEFSIRLDTYEVVRYRFDTNTHVVRDASAISVPALRPGEQVEVLSEPVAGSLLQYAKTVRVLVELPQQAYRMRRRALDVQEPHSSFDPLFSRGDMTLSGVVARIQSGRLLLHTREGDRTILLRDDTRYLENGELATAAALRPNMRVFVRAGRNLYDEVEGYQVIWGSILEPK